jgi:ribonuclease P protein component
MCEPSCQRRRFKFPARLRVLRRRDFERAFAEGLRSEDSRLTVWAIGNALGHPRLGLVVGRKHGGAVRRNRLRRIMREAFRLSRARLPAGLDLLCSPRPGADLDLCGCMESLVRLAATLEKRLARRQPREETPG